MSDSLCLPRYALPDTLSRVLRHMLYCYRYALNWDMCKLDWHVSYLIKKSMLNWDMWYALLRDMCYIYALNWDMCQITWCVSYLIIMLYWGTCMCKITWCVYALLRYWYYFRHTITSTKIQSTLDISNSDIYNSAKLEASIWITNTFWWLSLTITWRWILFKKSKLPEVQINLHFG